MSEQGPTWPQRNMHIPPEDRMTPPGPACAEAHDLEASMLKEGRARFLATATDIGELVEKKNAAYGSSFTKCGDFLKLLYPNGIKPEQYQDALLLVRIFDKQMRIATAKTSLGENPYRDIAGYGILGATEETNGR